MIRPDQCLMVMGRRGCGKSFLAKRLQALWPKRVIIDSLNEYSEGIKVNNFSAFCEQLKEFKNKKTNNFVLIFQFNPEDSLNQETFDQIMRVCYYFGKIQIVIEEVQLYASPHRLPHWLKQCLLTGRHKGLSLLFTTQRPGELNKTILSQCAHIFCGQIVEGNDLRYIASFLNQDAQRLSSLPERRFIYFSDDGIKEISNNF